MANQIYCDNEEKFQPIPRIRAVDEEAFEEISKNNKPAILLGCQFGDCMTKWNLGYLTDKLKDESVVMHEASTNKLDFINKNFTYRTCLFSEFAGKLLHASAKPESHVYLRSTNNNPRAKKPARIEDDFSQLASDLEPPEFIPFGNSSELYHSSVLRIASSGIRIWTHFDLYDNVLCQVVGKKRVILFAPKDTRYLYINGDKSPVNDFDDLARCFDEYPLMRNAEPYECIIEPGDSLYIPALWWHNIQTIDFDGTKENSHSIGFNIFWRDKRLTSPCYYALNDVYGNKELAPFEAAMTNIDKAISHLRKLPDKYSEFYKYLLLNRLKNKLFPDEDIVLARKRT